MIRRPNRRLSCAPSMCLVGVFATVATTAIARAQMSFVEHTEASGVNASHMPSALLLTTGSIYAYLNAGGVTGDFNGDGFADLFVVGGGQQPDRFYLSNGDGTFVDRSAAWGVNVKHMGVAGAVGDFDGDGWPDLFLTSFGLDGGPPKAGQHRLYRNNNGTSFVNVAAAAGLTHSSPIIFDGSGACFGDYNLNGHLDLAVTGWLHNTHGNRLFRNNGDSTFTDVTIEAGLYPGVIGVRGFSPRLIDMDGDGWPELLIAADFGTSRYFRNNGDGTFTDLTVASGTGLDDNGMGHTIADFNGNGRPDWFVTSIWQPGGSFETPGTGNMLYLNNGDHVYEEAAQSAGIHDAAWGWGTTVADFDHDGNIDVIATNGWFTQQAFINKPTRLWRGLGDGTFVDVAESAGLWHTAHGRGVLTMDFDGDGALDVVIFANQDKVRLYRNTLVNDGTRNWIRFRLRTSAAQSLAPDGIGSVVSVRTGGPDQAIWQQRWVEAGTNYQSQDEMVVHFGVGSAEVIDELRVRWTDGTTSALVNVPVNQFFTVSSGPRADLNGDGRVDGKDLGILLTQWGPCPITDPRDLNADGQIDALDVLLLFSNWTR